MVQTVQQKYHSDISVIYEANMKFCDFQENNKIERSNLPISIDNTVDFLPLDSFLDKNLEEEEYQINITKKMKN